MSTSTAQLLFQVLDDYALVVAGGLIYTYEAGTTTPLATYQDLEGLVPNENPIVLDAAGRPPADVRVTNGVAYKFVLQDADGASVGQTMDDFTIGTADGDSENQLLIPMTYCGTPGAQGFMGGAEIPVAATIPIDFDGASGSVQTNPATDYIISVQKNGTEVGTITISSAGVFTFDTTGGATVSLVFGDTIKFVAPASVGTAADFSIILTADLA